MIHVSLVELKWWKKIIARAEPKSTTGLDWDPLSSWWEVPNHHSSFEGCGKYRNDPWWGALGSCDDEKTSFKMSSVSQMNHSMMLAITLSRPLGSLVGECIVSSEKIETEVPWWPIPFLPYCLCPEIFHNRQYDVHFHKQNMCICCWEPNLSEKRDCRSRQIL